ncbi:MAG: divalent-cation tolerance protein CutA [Armatimonadetes bacterium]|nr:divalent-cation tolerance protein CutA [Armatimonadota bacterium]
MRVEHVVVLVTAASVEEATRLADRLVEEKLAACVNVVKEVASTYWWQGRVERAGEALLLIKTRRDRVEALTQRVRDLHSYTVPEVVVLPILEGNPPYLQWIDSSVG